MSVQVSTSPRRGGRSRVLTPDVLRIIPQWVEEGATRYDIADALGITVGSLEAGCSYHGVSLRAGGQSPQLERRLGRARWAVLQRQAQLRKITPFQLALRVLSATADGDLFNAVLDDAEDIECGVRS